MCEWESTNYSGRFGRIDTGNTQFYGICDNIPNWYPRSVYNNSVIRFIYYSGSNCTGTSKVVPSGASYSNLGFAARSMRDSGLG